MSLGIFNCLLVTMNTLLEATSNCFFHVEQSILLFFGDVEIAREDIGIPLIEEGKMTEKTTKKVTWIMVVN